MTLTGIHIEIWQSDHNREEHHYFLKDGETHGHQNAEYLFGINPKYFGPEKVRRILEMIES